MAAVKHFPSFDPSELEESALNRKPLSTKQLADRQKFDNASHSGYHQGERAFRFLATKSIAVAGAFVAITVDFLIPIEANT